MSCLPARGFGPLQESFSGRSACKADMKNQHAKIDRFNSFSDGIFAVLITILVLDLRPPASPTFNGLSSRWPSWISYAVSYVFVAIVWVNHHHLLRYAEMATPRVIWVNFA